MVLGNNRDVPETVKTVQVPQSVISFGDSMFARVINYLRKTGNVADNEEVTSISLKIEVEEPIRVVEFETRPSLSEVDLSGGERYGPCKVCGNAALPKHGEFYCKQHAP